MDERMIVDCLIVEAVRELSSPRRLGEPVLARDIHDFRDETGVHAVPATIRRHMARLAREGRLIRVSERGGYIVPDWRRMELPEVLAFEGGDRFVSFSYELDDVG